MTDTELARLIDKRRELAAQLAGVDIALCLAAGDREGAYRHLREMEAQVKARRAVREAKQDNEGIKQ